MKKTLLSLCAAFFTAASVSAQTDTPNNIYIHHTDRFCTIDSLSLEGIDSVEFTPTALKRWKYIESTGKSSAFSKSYSSIKDLDYFDFTFARYLAKPSGYANNDYTKETSQWCFQRSMESEHFICFWEEGLRKSFSHDVSYGGYTVNIKTLLNNAEKIFDIYVNKLGFLQPGRSITDKAKIHMYIVKTSWDGSWWRADGSGQDATVWYYDGSTKKNKATKAGLFHCTPSAASARGGHTPAHEIGHVFQYLVSADLGMSHGLNYGFGAGASGGNEWWEDCANWQAYKVYPERQFTDGEYLEGYMARHHLNIHHEESRYHNCFYHDWWCQQHGDNTIGRVWRESNKPEDPTEAYMRIFGYDVNTFADDQFEFCRHFTSFDIDNIRKYASTSKIGIEPQRLKKVSATISDKYLGGDTKYYVVDPNYCPENFGYNASALNVPAAGTAIKATFKGIAGADGYRKNNLSKAGWRYGFAAYCTDGKRYYSEAGKDAEGEITFTVPEKCKNLWFVVMGAPTEYWRHPWDDNASNDEQWPYAVKFEGATPKL